MFKSLKNKMILFFTLIILLSIATIDYFVLTKYIQERISDLQSRSFATANILADTSRYQLNYETGLRTLMFEQTRSFDGRILILNHVGQVIVDSNYGLEGEKLHNREVREALENRSSINLYSTPSKIMQLAVPITLEDGSEVIGAVLLSISMEELDTSFHQLRSQVIGISIFFAILSILLSILASQRITKPMNKLTGAARQISQGKLGIQVNIPGKDEVARFAETFNNMSKELAQIDKNRRNFISSASHELKTPLASIKALIQPLLDGENDLETHREFLWDIDGEIDRLSRLITSLLTLSRMEEMKINRSAQPLKPIIERVIHILQPMAKEYNVSIISRVEKETFFYLDRDLITEVFLNLIENAIKYRDPSKTCFVSIELEEGKLSDTIMIEDNGIGMGKELSQSIFKPFFRVDHSRARSTGGYGLGLSIVHSIIVLHGWKITLDSNPNHGSTFRIIIPKPQD